FSQADLNASLVTYTQDSTDTNDSFAFSVAEQSGTAATGTFSITFTEAAATVTANTGLSVGEGTTATLSSSQLAASADPGDPASELVYSVTTLPSHGTLKLNGTALASNSTFTQADINSSKVTYNQDGSDTNDSFAFTVVDNPGTAATGTFSITFT